MSKKVIFVVCFPFLIIWGINSSFGQQNNPEDPSQIQKNKGNSSSDRRIHFQFDPDPHNLSCDDCYTIPQHLNQYIITDVLSTSVSHDGSGNLTEWLRDRISWKLSGTEPQIIPMDSVDTTSGTSSDTLRPKNNFPFFIPSLTPTPVSVPTPGPTPTLVPFSDRQPRDGFIFDVRTERLPSSNSSEGWKFPVNNSSFGGKTFTHVLNGHSVNVPVALFYPSSGYQHPKGGPKGYFHWDPVLLTVVNDGDAPTDIHVEVDTPNWFYYYSQVFTAPYNTVINYRPVNEADPVGSAESGYTSGQDHVHIAENAHGLGDVELFAKLPSSAFVQVVGKETNCGIDTFVRVVTHECTHKRLYDAMHENLTVLAGGSDLPEYAVYRADSDGDGVPDSWENLVKLDPNRGETIRGWSQSYDVGNGAAPDNEVFGRMTERGLFGDITQDWADDGLNWKGLPAAYRYLRCQRGALLPRVEDLDDDDLRPQFGELFWPDARGVASPDYPGGRE